MSLLIMNIIIFMSLLRVSYPMQGYGKTGKDVKCPVMHGSMTNTDYGMANRDWWPKSLDLTIFTPARQKV